MKQSIERVLIANRGAIATRIERTLRRLNKQSVAVFSEADRGSLHVDGADNAVCLGAGSTAETYLNGHKLIQIALDAGAGAIHPGYGFLSENADFAEAVETAGLAFLGPRPEQIRAFGLKHEARRLAEQAAVPLLHGSALLANAGQAVTAATKIGWPVMLKSSAGGGGIGMRACRDQAELRDAYEAVTAQAASSFGDDRLFVERLVTAARHIEVQVFGDGEGTVAVLGDRDCSMQRRNQKVIEEAPAPHLPENVRTAMHEAARRLMAKVKYRSAGTVEFLYDSARDEFHFLEVNARLQVEHGVTEQVTGIDIVDWMLRLAQGERDFLVEPAVRGCAMQVRIYAEDPARNFRPAPGLITALSLPPISNGLRVDHWISAGTTVPSAYDPMLAKIIAHGANRNAARQRLLDAVRNTRIDGIETNQSFLAMALKLEDFAGARHNTRTISNLTVASRTVEVAAPGTQTSVQDVDGRLGYWHVGVPPSGAFDGRSLARANALLGNPRNMAGLEMLAEGPTLQFATAAEVAICGATALATLDGQPMPQDQRVAVAAGQTLSVGTIGRDGNGLRAYLAIAGGLDVPLILGSRATFDLGAFGGHAGRALRTGDILPIGEASAASPPADVPAPVSLSERTLLRVVQGPHTAPEYLTEAFLDQFYDARWTVNYNSSRTGIRLEGPQPQWARADGGDAGLHPSNVHDNAYAFGAIDFTGDMPIILGPDGPSLGGFVCPAAIYHGDRWKLGQLRPGDQLRFEPISLAAAQTQDAEAGPTSPTRSWRSSRDDVILGTDAARDVVLRAAGDQFLLLEFGEPVLDLSSRLRVESLQRWLDTQADPEILEMTPGVRSLQLRVPVSANRTRLFHVIQNGLDALGTLRNLSVPSRIVHLPLAWDDPATQEATARYSQSVRADAPWCPRNIEFIRRINGLDTEEQVKQIVYDASYLVLGLGDVYLGAPVATPIDPRHRLVTTKYNPARTWTPENAVGIGGAYLCIYGMEGPGGYQFVGRTIQVWDRYRRDGVFDQPWLLRGFDQLRFFEVSNDELQDMRRDFPLGRLPLKIEESEFAMAEHQDFLAQQAESIGAFRTRQQQAFSAERARWEAQGYDPTSFDAPPQAEELAADTAGTILESPVTGSVWKVLAEPDTAVAMGEVIMIIESMKTEIEVTASTGGHLERILVKPGTAVEAGQAVALVEPG